MAEEFIKPDFLLNQSKDEILARMLSTIPDTIAKEENGWVTDLLLSAAIEKSELVEFILVEAIKNIIPKYAYGYILDGHAENRGLKRKIAEYSKMLVTIKGIPKTVIPKGFGISTPSTYSDSGILFSVDEEVTMPEDGAVTVHATALKSGAESNVAAETVILMVKPIKGITGIVNNQPSYGGFDEESDESLRSRIAEYDLQQGNSFVGSPSDYRRWAMAVTGVGSAKVLGATDDTGTVTIIITDLNGQPANDEICRNVYDHIMKPDNPDERLAPVNALLNVIPPIVLEVAVSADIIINEGYSLEIIKAGFIMGVSEYFKTDEAKAEIKYTEIGAILIRTEGVKDYGSLFINEGIVNIKVEKEQMPVINSERVVFTVT